MNTPTPTPKTDDTMLGVIISDANKRIKQLQRKITIITEQRDRLAEAIRKYTGGNYPESFLSKTLQSLNLNEL